MQGITAVGRWGLSIVLRRRNPILVAGRDMSIVYQIGSMYVHHRQATHGYTVFYGDPNNGGRAVAEINYKHAVYNDNEGKTKNEALAEAIAEADRRKNDIHNIGRSGKVSSQ